MFFFTLFYLLFSFLLIYPPIEFISAGLTIPRIFSRLLGSENEHFIQYHIYRVAITAFVHSCLPLGYIIGLFLNHPLVVVELVWSETTSIWWQVLLGVAITGPFVSTCKIIEWARDSWGYHPISLKIKQFTTETTPWTRVTTNINAEFKRIDKINIQSNPTTKILVTDNWIMKVGMYGINFALQNEAMLRVNNSDTHQLSLSTGGEMQFINIEVRSLRVSIPVFNIRLNALDFKDLQDKILRPISVLPNIVFHKTLTDKFIEVFKDQVVLNEKYSTSQEIEYCIGCMQTISNVKLNKLCDTSSDTDRAMIPPVTPCTSCHCRPMWCIDCIARWFASRQDPEHTDKWLSSKCTCPVCRATFCLLDVSYIITEDT